MKRIRSPLTSFLSRLQTWLDSPWLDALAIAVWGFLLLKYWMTGKLNILIHPNYFALTVFGGVGLLILGGFRAWELWRKSQKTSELATRQSLGHITLFPRGWSTALLAIAALLGLLITPQTFGSQTALQRGLTESLPVTRIQPQEFRTAAKPEERALIEWVRLLNVNPEPDTYTGQKVNVTGFVIYPPSLPKNYIWISRFVITCCAADAYPVGLPVLLPDNNRAAYPQDSWLQVEGEMMTQVLDGERKLTIRALKLMPISEPRNPYEY